MYAGHYHLDVYMAHYAFHHNWIVSNHNWWVSRVLIQKIQLVAVFLNHRSNQDNFCLAYIYNATAIYCVDKNGFLFLFFQDSLPGYLIIVPNHDVSLAPTLCIQHFLWQGQDKFTS